jgi:hypothetical protein
MRPVCIAEQRFGRRRDFCITVLMRPVCIAGQGLGRRRDLCITGRGDGSQIELEKGRHPVRDIANRVSLWPDLPPG